MRGESGRSAFPVLNELKRHIAGRRAAAGPIPFRYPAPIAKALGFRLVSAGAGVAVLEHRVRLRAHGNAMGALHGGILAALADMAIGVAHATTLKHEESFASIDLSIEFLRPGGNGKIRASARALHRGMNISRYVCEILREDGKLCAYAVSGVTMLRRRAQ